MTNLRFRQIHLDFHTSEEIPGIGSAFDANEFADTLAEANVNSVTCFSRCHHGWIYHETAKFPERKHPHLTCNLLAEQIEACHARGIRVPIYVTVRWDHFTARQHPEWLVVDENGCFVGTKPYEAGFYRQLCLNSPYVDFLEAQTVEVCETLPTDGFFFDIVFSTPCSCEDCKRDMLAAGMDPANPQERALFADQVLQRFQERMTAAVRAHHPEATIFYNSGHVGPRHRPILHNFTHLELESLPGGGWGYMHFPIAQRFARTLGVDTMGMTGKFHTTWGDFSSFKNPAALEFECLHMLALGAKCSIGDQLHPTGRICAETYKLIGGVYAKVKAAEPWCEGARPLVDIALMTSEEWVGGGHAGMPPATIGATRILQELRQQFNIVDSQSELSGYKVVVLPDEIPLDEALTAKLSAYIAGGGAVLATHKSGLNPEGNAFALRELGVEFVGEARYSPDFIVAGKLGGPRPETPVVMYSRGVETRPQPGAEILSTMVLPYFNRTWRHFCSHGHTPAAGPADYPGAVRNGNCIYLMHPVFSLYARRAPRWCKDLVAGALALLLPEPLVEAQGPSTLLLTLNEQPQAGRLVLHALHYVPERRGQELDTIEDILPVYDVKVSVRAERPVERVTLEPQGEPLEFTLRDGRVGFTIPRIEGHQLVVLA
ncbi:MAG: beta-galactosidase [Armatimonadetes bacterium]|nr:beta-galactosidase [Armatimonadota bacterium]